MNNKIIFLSAILFSAVMSAQVKIGGTDGTPNANAMLEVESTTKGVLLPRVALTSTAAFAPLTAHVAGMTVYNTATAGDVTPGQYYNDGTKWNRIVNSSEVPAGVVVTANNGLTKTGDNIALGGNLTASTTVTTTAANDLTIATTAAGTTGKLKVTGLAATTAVQLPTDKIIVQDAAGVLKTANVSDFARTKNTTVYRAENDGAWSLLGLTIGGTNWSKINLQTGDTKLGDPTLFSNGNYTVPSTGIYAVNFEVQLEGGVDLGVLGGRNVAILKNNTILEQKIVDAVRVSILGITLASVPVTSTSINTLHSLTAGDVISFGAEGSVLDLGLLTDGKVSIHIYKISDL